MCVGSLNGFTDLDNVIHVDLIPTGYINRNLLTYRLVIDWQSPLLLK